MLNQYPAEQSRPQAPSNVNTGLSNGIRPPQTAQLSSNYVAPASQKPTNPNQPMKSTQPTVQVRTVFMDEQMQAKAIELAKEACMNEKMSVSPREIAGHLKLAFDELYGPAWHCVVGRSYGSFVTHEKESFIFFYVDHWAIMLFKTA